MLEFWVILMTIALVELANHLRTPPAYTEKGKSKPKQASTTPLAKVDGVSDSS
mgnify:CR=1 FL=1